VSGDSPAWGWFRNMGQCVLRERTPVSFWKSESRLSKVLRARVCVGRVLGTPVSIHFSWFLSTGLSVAAVPHYFISRYWVMLFWLVFFFVIFAHELGHMLVARRYGYPTQEIVLWTLGGFALINIPQAGRGELPILAAGPLVNLLLVPLTFPFWYLLEHRLGEGVRNLLWAVGWANLWMLVLNLIPIYPLDGGRILLSVISVRAGMMWGRLLASVVGIGCTSVLLAGLYFIGDILDAVLFSPLILINGSILQWALRMRAYERRTARHARAQCPHCRERGFDAAYQVCATCMCNFNPFSLGGKCWNCSTSGAALRCSYCGESAEISRWLASEVGAESYGV